MSTEPGKIRNVAVVGHRGTGKTSLVEAMLFEAGAINRLGTRRRRDDGLRLGRGRAAPADVARRVALPPRVAGPQDQPDRHARATPASRPTRLRACSVVEGALVVVSGVMGVEVNTARVWSRAEELELSRVVFVNMLDRERADFYRTLASLQEQLSSRCVAIQLPIGTRARGDRGHRPAAQLRLPGSRRRRARATPVADPRRAGRASRREYREKLLDAVVETDEALMERYLAGEELDPAAVAAALKTAVTNDELYPVACGVATKNLGTHALLDLLVEGVPSPARKPSPIETDGGDRWRSSSRRSPIRSPGRISVLPRLRRRRSAPTRRSSTSATRRRSGSAG